MKKILMVKFGMVGLFSALLIGCFGESSDGGEAVNADAIDDLPKCTEMTEGDTVVVEDSLSYKCESGEWNQYSIKDEDEQENPASSSSAKRKKKNNEWNDDESSSSSAKSSSSGEAGKNGVTDFDNMDEVAIHARGLESKSFGNTIEFNGRFSGISNDGLDSVVFIGLSFIVAKVSGTGNLVSTTVNVSYNEMEFPSTSDIDLNSTLSAGVSVNLLDPGFRTCGEHSLVVTVIATDGTKEFVKKEMIPFNRDEEYCQVTSFSSSSGAKKVACYGQGACMEADASKSSDCGKNDKSAIVLASCPAGGEICDLSKMGIDDMMLYIYPESKYDCAFYKAILANAPIEDLSGN